MVEFALVAPLFFMVVFGGIEIGLMFRSYLAVENISRSGARIASIQRDSPDADDAILDRIENQVAPLQGDVTQIVIFKADALDDDVPTNCLTSSQSGSCNSYAVPDGDVALANPGTLGWDPTTRRAGDNIGIHIVFEYRYATGFFNTLTLSTTTVEVIESDF